MKRSWTTLIVLILYAIFINSTVSEQQLLPLWLDEDEPVEVHDVKNDKITIVWQLPTEIANMTTKQRLMAFVLTSSTIVGRNSMTVNLNETERSYTFDNLVGNTTYRVSVEAFREDESLWYGSNMATTSLAGIKKVGKSTGKQTDLALDWLPPPTELQLNDKTEDSLEISWAPPDVSQSGTSVIINQYLINFFEFYPSTQTFTKKISVNVPIPKTSYLAARLNRGSVYNVTIQAGTSYGYGNMAWSVYNTLPNNASTHTLKLKAKAPNSLLLAWPATWMSTPNAKFTIKAKTLHSMDGVDKEYMNSGFIEVGKPAEFLIKNLSPGSTYNVTISTPAEPEKSRGKWGRPIRMKSSWAVFSTLIQGEYTVSEARIVVETDSAASIVFQPLQVHGVVSYQFRYAPVEEDSNFPVIETRELHDEELKCPKFGCEWRCHLFFNLLRRPREYTFSIRANVDGHWNKWVQVQRRPWNLLERVCSINPPTSFVDNIGKLDHQRLIDLQNAPGRMSTDAWRFLVVVDSRYSKIASIDMTKLADKATADFDHIPYYISASLTPDEVDDFKDFKIGDGKVYGGYLNYPLLDPENDPQWTLVPMGQQENEIMEPRLRTCGFTEQGAFECDMAFSEVFNYIPGWVKIATAVLFVLLTFACCMGTTCFCRKCCANKSKSKESTSLYYHNSSPHHSFVTQEYRRVDQREFTLDQDSERRIFLDYLE